MGLESINIEYLVVHVLIVAVSTIGIVQWIKNFYKDGKPWVYALISLGVCIPIAIVQAPFVSGAVKLVLDLVFLGLSVCQIAYEYIVQGVRDLISKFMKTGEVEAQINKVKDGRKV